jgi:hypothetical protein
MKAQTTRDGIGPVLRRCYSAKVIGSHMRAEDVMRRVLRHFPELAPAMIAEFTPETNHHALRVGDELTIKLPLMAPIRVRLVHQEPRSLTLQTLAGHPEAGQISFGCERHGKVLRLKITSRARAASFIDLCGYWVAGRKLQTHLWREFLTRAASLSGGKLEGPVTATTDSVREHHADRAGAAAPTFTR